MSITSWWYTQGRRLWVVLGSGSVLVLMGWKEDGQRRKGWSSAWDKVYRRGVQRAKEKSWLDLRWGRALWVANCHRHTSSPWVTTGIRAPVGFFPLLACTCGQKCSDLTRVVVLLLSSAQVCSLLMWEQPWGLWRQQGAFCSMFFLASSLRDRFSPVTFYWEL